MIKTVIDFINEKITLIEHKKDPSQDESFKFHFFNN